jgi:hypothetical protein
VKVAATQYPGTLVIESNSYGNQVVEHMYNSEFAMMVYKEKVGKNTLKPGLSTTAKTRPLMIDALYSYMTQYPESIKSERLALELTGLVSKTSGKVEADTGCHDDLALAAAVCMYVRKYDPPLLIDSEKFSSISTEMMDIMKMNLDRGDDMFTDYNIMKKVKSDESGGFIDTLQFFRE